MPILDITSIISSSTSITCDGGNSCCTKYNQCSQWEGDCDNDDECKADLICGNNNCPIKTGMEWDESDDCCVQGKREPIFLRISMIFIIRKIDHLISTKLLSYRTAHYYIFINIFK